MNLSAGAYIIIMCWTILKKSVRNILKLLVIIILFLLISPGLVTHINNIKDKEDRFNVLLDFITLEITILGLTLLGGIYEKRKLGVIEKKLTTASFYFLMSVFFLFIYITSVYSNEETLLYSTLNPSAELILIGSILFFNIGLVEVGDNLFKYIGKISNLI